MTSANGATSELGSEVSRNSSCTVCLVERKFPLENQQKWWKSRRVEKRARLEPFLQIVVQSRPLVLFHFYTLLPNWNPDPRSLVPDHRFTNTDASDRPTFDRPKKGKTIGFRSKFPTFQLHLFQKVKFETLTTYVDSLTNTGDCRDSKHRHADRPPSSSLRKINIPRVSA